jgi:hypothetical protein
MEAMLWLSGEPLGPYWGGMGVKVWEMPCGLGAPGHKVSVLPCGLRVEGHKVCVLPYGLGGLVDRKSKRRRGPGGESRLFGLWGVGG